MGRRAPVMVVQKCEADGKDVPGSNSVLLVYPMLTVHKNYPSTQELPLKHSSSHAANSCCTCASCCPVPAPAPIPSPAPSPFPLPCKQVDNEGC